MATSEELVARFSDPNGFKKYIGFLGGKRAKAAHALFTTAEQRGAVESYVLDTREHDDTYYHLRAISTQGNLDEATLAELSREAQLVPLGTVRYEGMLAPTLPEAVGSNPEAADVHALSRLDRGIVVYPVTELSKKGRSSWALWAVKGGHWFVYPIEDKKL